MFTNTCKKLQDHISQSALKRKRRCTRSVRRALCIEMLELRVVLSVSNPAFVSQVNGIQGKLQSESGELFSIDTSGTTEQITSQQNATLKKPVWSPDGEQVAYRRYNDDTNMYELWHVQKDPADGTWSTPALLKKFNNRDTMINANGDLTGYLDWSPDGSRIAYQSYNLDVTVLDVESGNVQSVFGNGDRSGGKAGQYPTWSPDVDDDLTNGYQGFLGFLGGDLDISNDGEVFALEVNIDTDGSLTTGSLNVLTDTPDDIDQRFLNWAPDGPSIAYLHHQGDDIDHLQLLHLDVDEDRNIAVNGVSRLLDDSADIPWQKVAWSPQSQYIGFWDIRPTGGRKATTDIFAVRPDNTGLVNVTNTDKRDERDFDWNPHWVNDLDGDNPVSLAIDDVSVTEGDSGTVTADFTVSLSEVAGQDVTVDFATQDDTATIGDNDYQAASGTLTISAGETSGTISVTVNGDTNEEGDETFVVNLSNPSGATLADDQAVGTILGDDQPASTVTVDAIDPASMPAGSTVGVTVTGSGFQTGADLTFENFSGPDPTASNVVVEDVDGDGVYDITADVTAGNKGPKKDRMGDVVVTNPDGASGTCSGCFTVTASSGLRIAGGAHTEPSSHQPLSQETLRLAADEARGFWRHGLESHDGTGFLDDIQVRMADFTDARLGAASPGGIVWIDDDAGGHGWSVGNSGRGVDLLPVVIHEAGHVLGFPHGSHEVMVSTISPDTAFDLVFKEPVADLRNYALNRSDRVDVRSFGLQAHAAIEAALFPKSLASRREQSTGHSGDADSYAQRVDHLLSLVDESGLWETDNFFLSPGAISDGDRDLLFGLLGSDASDDEHQAADIPWSQILETVL